MCVVGQVLAVSATYTHGRRFMLAYHRPLGKVMLRESAMCPDADKASFEDINRHKFFNTNNLWISLPALHAKLAACDGVLPMPLIKNKKTVNPRDSGSAPVYQLETAMGRFVFLGTPCLA